MTQNRRPNTASPARAASFRLIDLSSQRDPLVLTIGTPVECAPGIHITVGSPKGEALLEISSRTPSRAAIETTIDGTPVVDLAQLAPGQVIAGDGFEWVYLKPLQAYVRTRKVEDEGVRSQRLELLIGSERYAALVSSSPAPLAGPAPRRDVVQLRPVAQRPVKQSRSKPRTSFGRRFLRLALAASIAAAGAGAALTKDLWQRSPHLPLPAKDEVPAAATASNAPEAAPEVAQEAAPTAAAPAAPAAPSASVSPAAPVATTAPIAAAAPVVAPVPQPAQPAPAPASQAAIPAKPAVAKWIKPAKSVVATKSPKSSKPADRPKTPAAPQNYETLRPQFQEAVLLKGFDPQGALRDLKALAHRVPPSSRLGQDIRAEMAQLERR